MVGGYRKEIKGWGKRDSHREEFLLGSKKRDGNNEDNEQSLYGVLVSPFPFLPLSSFWAQTEKLGKKLKSGVHWTVCEIQHHQDCFGVWDQQIIQNEKEAKRTFFPWPPVSNYQRSQSSALRYSGLRTVISSSGLCLEEQHIPFQRRCQHNGEDLWQGRCNGELVDWFPNTNERSLEIRKNHGGRFWERVITMNMCVLLCSLWIIFPYLIFSQWA